MHPVIGVEQRENVVMGAEALSPDGHTGFGAAGPDIGLVFSIANAAIPVDPMTRIGKVQRVIRRILVARFRHHESCGMSRARIRRNFRTEEIQIMCGRIGVGWAVPMVAIPGESRESIAERNGKTSGTGIIHRLGDDRLGQVEGSLRPHW